MCAASSWEAFVGSSKSRGPGRRRAEEGLGAANRGTSKLLLEAWVLILRDLQHVYCGKTCQMVRAL